MIWSNFSQILLSCLSESRWYQILKLYTWWHRGWLLEIPLMTNFPWLFNSIMTTNDALLMVDVLQFISFVLQIHCLLFGTQSTKGIFMPWISKVLNIRMRCEKIQAQAVTFSPHVETLVVRQHAQGLFGSAPVLCIHLCSSWVF